jgi:hypothetical protein
MGKRLLMVMMMVAGVIFLPHHLLATGTDSPTAAMPSEWYNSTALADAKPTDTNLRLEVKFCDSSTKYFTTNPWARFTLCAEVINPFAFPVTAHFFINNGSVDANGTYLCDAFATSMSENFGWYDERITVPALDSVRITPTAVFDAGDFGEQIGCLSHEINQEGAVAEEWYAIRLRNSSTFTVLVTGTIHTTMIFTPSVPWRMLGQRSSIGVWRDGNLLLIGTTVENQWALVQNFMLSGYITDLMGRVYPLQSATGSVVPWKSLVLTSTVLDTLPWYQFWFGATVSLDYTAEYDNVDPSLLTDEITQTSRIQEEVSFIILPWWLIIGLGFVILLALIFNRIDATHRQQLADLEAAKRATLWQSDTDWEQNS